MPEKKDSKAEAGSAGECCDAVIDGTVTDCCVTVTVMCEPCGGAKPMAVKCSDVEKGKRNVITGCCTSTPESTE